jgi:bifunctional UDP-N-acetylglucosamine pyrophosphorylase/glucosamine-1-phosphate N-acetyltransferase
MKPVIAIVLAAGEGTRMKSQTLPKVLHPICWKPMIGYILETIQSAGIKKIIVVTGYKAEQVQRFLGTNPNGHIRTVKQTRPLGTADAVNCTRRLLKDFKGDLLILYGDMPLITKDCLQTIVHKHQSQGAACTLLTAMVKNPTGFGRIARDENGRVMKIVEERDASLYEKVIEEINVGAYCFDKESLFGALKHSRPHTVRSHKEYYLTDAVSFISRRGKRIESIFTTNMDEAFGVSSRNDLVKAQDIIRKRTLSRLIEAGVTIVDPQTTYIDDRVKVKQDTVIHPFSIIEGEVDIGSRCSVGPFCRIKGKAWISDDVEIGNFVQIVNSSVGRQTVVANHTFLKDASVPANSIAEGVPAKFHRKGKT